MTDNRTTLLPCPFCGGEARHYAPGPIDHHIECVECYADIHRDTEAEAIAAWNTRADYHGYEYAAIEAWESIKAWNTRAELVSGTLTAEQVSEAAYAHSIHADCADADWQAIADELNAVLGGGECHCETSDDAWCFSCSSCGKSFPRNKLHLAHNHGEINYCPNCGRKVVSE